MKTERKISEKDKMKNGLKKSIVLFLTFLFQTGLVLGQSQPYDNMDGKKAFTFGEKSGMLDTTAMNPAPGTDNVKKCYKYVRNGSKQYDNVKLNFSKKLTDVNKYATYTGVPQKISMKLYTTAPAGTLVEIQLGKQGKEGYPGAINSVYQAKTTVTNGWEDLQFKFAQTPVESKTSATQVDQLTLLFNPNSTTSDTYYFYNITGPMFVSDKVDVTEVPVDNTKTTLPAKNGKGGTK